MKTPSWIVVAVAVVLWPSAVFAQAGPGGPPSVGVVAAALRSVTQQQQISGRVEAIERVHVVARVAAFLEERLFTEGTEIEAGQLLYRLERGSYEATVESAHAAIDQAQAQLENARLTLDRQEKLLTGPAGLQSAADQARAARDTAAGQLRAAKAQLRQAEINLAYTEIRSPIAGRIGRTAVTVGNLVGPSSGTLVTVVSQDPMHVVFPIAVRRALDLRARLLKDGFSTLKVRLQLPDGRIYAHEGTVEFLDINVAADTDTILLRGTIPNPLIAGAARGLRTRELTAGELVTVLLEDVAPAQLVAVPRAALLTDQRGVYVYVVDRDNVARRRDIKPGASSPEFAIVESGLSIGDRVVVEGVQRVRPNAPVSPEPIANGAPDRIAPSRG